MKTTRDYYEEYAEEARHLLLENCPIWEGLVQSMDQFISLILSTLKTLSVSDIEQKYHLTLIVSFIRSHFVIIDLIESSNLIEAATLIRKQAELLARFNEIGDKDITKLFGVTPNIKAAKIGPTYGSLSEIAHSSKIETMSLLGIEDDGEQTCFSVYPVFNQHTLKTVSIYCDVFCKFSAAILQFELVAQAKDFSTISMEIINNFINIGLSSNIEYFEIWKE